MFCETAQADARLKLTLWVFAILWGVAFGFWLLTGDTRITAYFAAPPFNTTAYGLFHWLSRWGMYVFYVLFLGVLIAGWRKQDAWLKRIGQTYLLAQLFGAFLLVRVIKIGCGRARPGVDDLSSLCPGPNLAASYNSFPSGHTADLTLSALFVLALLRPLWAGLAAALIACGVALSRIVLHSHYASDVLAGAAIGALAVWVAFRFFLFRKPVE